mmetsp:Transcript_12309/g.28882  ORF Transcript_12309/g.28882 Transcript_12309/m.28882 type:complete len:248 (-) Transcript_12309:226-969(-)
MFPTTRILYLKRLSSSSSADSEAAASAAGALCFFFFAASSCGGCRLASKEAWHWSSKMRLKFPTFTWVENHSLRPTQREVYISMKWCCVTAFSNTSVIKILMWSSVLMPQLMSCLKSSSNFSSVSLFNMLFMRRVTSSSLTPAASSVPNAPRRWRCRAAQESSETASFSALAPFCVDHGPFSASSDCGPRRWRWEPLARDTACFEEPASSPRGAAPWPPACLLLAAAASFGRAAAGVLAAAPAAVEG